MRSLKITFPDGRIKRRHTDRNYLAAVIVEHYHEWVDYRWCMSECTRDKTIKEAKRYYENVLVVPVVVIQKTPRLVRQVLRNPKSVDRCIKCGAPRSRHYELCQHCRREIEK